MATLPQAVRTAAAFTAALPEQAKCFLLYDNCFPSSVMGLSIELWCVCTPVDLYLRGEQGFSQFCSIPQGLQGISLVNEVFFKAEA